ncbi:ABC transporter ATP-binding protein [Streptomyces sp. NPDC001922]|uniref:ABC transporter ATP-binding protein n=1 Tax=Streptomyces sp. NPDC001922 TaxID=3364624 RepID=UPI0036AEF3FE
MTEPVARIEDLRVVTGGRTLVDGVCLTVLPGRCTALVGPSGSGKTTTGLALLGEYPAGARVTGRVDVPGGRAGYVPQHPAAALNPARRAGALLGDIARRTPGTRADRTARVAEALRLAQLPDPDTVLRRFPHQLSGGQQQRVVLAQALLSGARVVVADEPTTGQDALTKRRMAAELRELRARGIGLLLLSHDLDLVRELADTVVVLQNGRAVESGAAEQVLTAPRHPAARALLARDASPVPVRTPGAGDRAPEDGAPCLEAVAVRARHGGRRTGAVVLRDASVAVAAGTCLAVVGRSGSGKTTLARCLAGLHRDWSGRVLLDGRPLPRSLRGRSREQLAAVQYVFQDAHAAFDPYRTVLDQVSRTAVRLRGATADAARAEALALLAGLGLPEETARRRPAGLSGGELQRAALARALLARPRVLVCDEITSGLDTVTRHAIGELLRRQRDEAGTALVLVTHDLAVAAGLADTVAVVEAGRVVEQGRADQLWSAPAHPFTRELLAAANGPGGTVRAAPRR